MHSAAAISYILGRARGPMEFQMRMRLCAYEIVRKDFRQDAARNRSPRGDRPSRRRRGGIKIAEGEREEGDRARRRRENPPKIKPLKIGSSLGTTQPSRSVCGRPTGKKGLSLSPPLRPSLIVLSRSRAKESISSSERGQSDLYSNESAMEASIYRTP